MARGTQRRSIKALVRPLIRQAVLGTTVFTVACSSSPSNPTPPVARNLIIVTIDTLRADRLGCYGNPDVATPNLDRIAREGAMAPQATVQVPLTRPSHTSIFTGLYPAEHGIRDNISPSLSKDIPTLAEILKGAGFSTGGFVSSVVVSAQSGLGRGFDTYSDKFDMGKDDARFLNTIQKRGDGTTGEAVEWIDAHKANRLFAWLHLYDPHDPYEPPEPYASKYADRPYDGEVAWSDELVGRLDAALARAGLRENTLIVVTSDHGEGLGEHGETVHGFFVYESTLRVPLILRGPGVRDGARLGVVARSVDLLPTALDLLGLSTLAPKKISGRSLAEAFRGRLGVRDEPSFSESLLPLVHYGWSDLRTVKAGRWKYILAPRPELYDVERDPHEADNLASAEPDRAKSLRGVLEQHLAKERSAGRVTSSPAAVSPDLLEQLGALGYVGGAGGAVEGRASGADPKDKIEEYKVLNRLMREGLISLREKNYAASAGRFTLLLDRGVESFEVHYYMGRALVGQGRWPNAARHFERAIAKLPAFTSAYLELAGCRVAMNDLNGAVGTLHQGQSVSPNDPRLYEREAEVWRRRGDKRQAARAYETELLHAPRDALVRVRLGELYRDLGREQDAIRVLREAVTIDPSQASYWNSLGMVLGGAGSLAEAEAAFREAMSKDAGDAQYAYNLGLAIERQGRAGDAVPLFRKALQIDPRFAAARDRLNDLASR